MTLDPEMKLKYLQEYESDYVHKLTEGEPMAFEKWLEQKIIKRNISIGESERKYKKMACIYCRRPFDGIKVAQTKDHVVPTSRGGLNLWQNKVFACKDCNQWKSDKSLVDWLKEVKGVLKSGKNRSPYNAAQIGTMAGSIRKVIEDFKFRRNIVSKYKK